MATEVIYDILKEIAGPGTFLISLIIGIGLGKYSLDDNPGEETHKILDGMALKILKDNKIKDWGPKEISLITYSMLANPITRLNKTIHMIYYVFGAGGFGAVLNIILDRLLIP